MKSEISSVSSVLVNLGEAIRADADINMLSRRYFGRGVLVAVGGYPDGILDETDAPFVMIRTDDEDSDATTGDITGLSVMIVLALAPTKDVPSTDDAIKAAESMLAKAETCTAHVAEGSPAVNAVYAAAECGTSEASESVKASVVAARTSMLTAAEACADAVAAAKEYAVALDVDNVLTQLQLALSYSATVSGAEADFADAAATASDLAEDAGETEKQAAADEVETAADLNAATLVSATETATTARTALSTAWDEYANDPYIRETVTARDENHGGLVIFGATRMLDGFRRAIYRVLADADVGMPLQEISFKNNSSSHQPLDWLEVTATFSEVQSF